MSIKTASNNSDPSSTTALSGNSGRTVITAIGASSYVAEKSKDAQSIATAGIMLTDTITIANTDKYLQVL